MNRAGNLVGYAGLLLLVAAAAVRLVVVDSSALALGVAALGLVLFLVYFFRSGADVQRFLGRRSTREGGSVLGITLFVLGILILVNLFGARIRWFRDVTADRIFTLAPETISALENAPADPEVFVFHPEGSPVQMALSELVAAASLEVPRLTAQVVDPDRDPALAYEFGLTAYASVVRIGERTVTFTGWHEEDFVSAVVRASRDRPPTIGFLDGHGEAFPADETPKGIRDGASLLDRRGFVVRGVNLLGREGSLRDDLDLLVIAGPRSELEPAEADSIRGYLDGGGRLLVLLDPESPARLAPVLAPFGLDYRPLFLDDPDQREPQILLPGEATAHPVVRDLRNRRLSPVFPGAGEIVREARGGVRNAILLSSGPRTRPVSSEEAPRRRGLAAAAERSVPGGSPARLVVIGDADFATNAMFSTLGNGDLFLGAVQWLAEQENLVSIRPRLRTSRPVVVTRQQGRALMVVLVGLVPLAVLVVGSVVWWRRR